MVGLWNVNGALLGEEGQLGSVMKSACIPTGNDFHFARDASGPLSDFPEILLQKLGFKSAESPFSRFF